MKPFQTLTILLNHQHSKSFVTYASFKSFPSLNDSSTPIQVLTILLSGGLKWKEEVGSFFSFSDILKESNLFIVEFFFTNLATLFIICIVGNNGHYLHSL